jgi:hypothetical protein
MRHLTLPKRQRLYELHQQQLSQAEIARRLGVHRSTVKRELEKNSVNGEYQAEQAQQLSLSRKQKAGRENQQQRFYYFYEVETLIKANIQRRITRRENKDQFTESKKRPYERYGYVRLRYWKLQRDLRRQRKRKRKRTPDYHNWKSWHDARYRMRNHFVEGFLRYFRYPSTLAVYRKTAWELRRSKKPFSAIQRSRLADQFLEAQEYFDRLHEQNALDCKKRLQEKYSKKLKPSYPNLSQTSETKLIVLAGIAVPELFVLKIFETNFIRKSFAFFQKSLKLKNFFPYRRFFSIHSSENFHCPILRIL